MNGDGQQGVYRDAIGKVFSLGLGALAWAALRVQSVSPGHHSQGQANPGTRKTIKALMNVPSGSSSKGPSQGCHWDPRTLEVAVIPFHSAAWVCSSVTCGQRRRDSMSVPFSDWQDQLGGSPSLPPRSL